MNIRATIRRRRGGDRVIKVSESGGTRSRRRPARLLKDSGRTQPELRIPGAAAQTRVVCVAGIRLGSGESARAFKGIICDDISEFESYMPSHAVWSLWDMSRLQNYVPEGPSASPTRLDDRVPAH